MSLYRTYSGRSRDFMCRYWCFRNQYWFRNFNFPQPN